MSELFWQIVILVWFVGAFCCGFKIQLCQSAHQDAPWWCYAWAWVPFIYPFFMFFRWAWAWVLGVD
jgi:hypothetical protein